MCCLLFCVHSYILAIYVWLNVSAVQLGVFSTKSSLFNTHYMVGWVQQTRNSIDEAVALRVSCSNKPGSFLVRDVFFKGVNMSGVRCIMNRMSSNISAVHVAVRNSMLHVKKDPMSATMRYFDLNDLPLQYIWRKFFSFHTSSYFLNITHFIIWPNYEVL